MVLWWIIFFLKWRCALSFLPSLSCEGGKLRVWVNLLWFSPPATFLTEFYSHSPYATPLHTMHWSIHRTVRPCESERVCRCRYVSVIHWAGLVQRLACWRPHLLRSEATQMSAYDMKPRHPPYQKIAQLPKKEGEGDRRKKEGKKRNQRKIKK